MYIYMCMYTHTHIYIYIEIYIYIYMIYQKPGLIFQAPKTFQNHRKIPYSARIRAPYKVKGILFYIPGPLNPKL